MSEKSIYDSSLKFCIFYDCCAAVLFITNCYQLVNSDFVEQCISIVFDPYHMRKGGEKCSGTLPQCSP